MSLTERGLFLFLNVTLENEERRQSAAFLPIQKCEESSEIQGNPAAFCLRHPSAQQSCQLIINFSDLTNKPYSTVSWKPLIQVYSTSTRIQLNELNSKYNQNQISEIHIHGDVQIIKNASAGINKKNNLGMIHMDTLESVFVLRTL